MSFSLISAGRCASCSMAIFAAIILFALVCLNRLGDVDQIRHTQHPRFRL